MKTFHIHLLLPSAIGLLVLASGSVKAQNAAPAPAPAQGASAQAGQGQRTTNNGQVRGTQTAQPQAGQPQAQQQQEPGQPQQPTAPPSSTANQNRTGTSLQSNVGTQPNQAQGTAQGATAVGTQGATTSRSLAQPATTGSSVLPDGTIMATGTIHDFGAGGLSIRGDLDALPASFAVDHGTLYLDSAGTSLTREQFVQRERQLPVAVYYTRTPEGSMIARRVVRTQVAGQVPAESAGTITEVSPGILVIEQPGASDTPIRYVNNTTTNYVNQAGEPVPPESVKPGTPVKIFYTKVGDTLVASKVEVQSSDASGLPKPPTPVNEAGTTTPREQGLK